MNKNPYFKQVMFWILLAQLLPILKLKLVYSQSNTSSNKQAVYFTPDGDLNNQLINGRIDPLDVFGLSTTDEGLTINPILKENWTWLAVKNLSYQGKSHNFFLMDGWLYTTNSIFTSYRRKKYQRDVSHLVKANVFALAFYAEKVIEKELVVFIASEEAVEAEIMIDRTLWGEEKKITYPLKAGEGHFFSVLKMADEYKPIFFPNKQVARHTIDLNQDWKFRKQDVNEAFRESLLDDDWPDVSIPHCWNQKDVYDTRNVTDGYEVYHAFYRGVGWYRKRFSLDPSLNGQQIFLQFEGANQIAEVWVNDHFVGKHVGGYTGFSFDITEFVNFDQNKNLIAVKVDNAYNHDVPPHTADFVMYGGLYRDVSLLVTDKLHVQDVYLISPEVSHSEANVKIQTEVNNDTDKATEALLLTSVVNREGEIEATVKSSHRLDAGSVYQFQQTTPVVRYPKLWSPDDPYLYSVYSTIYVNGKPVDEIKTPFGFRWFSFDANEGFFLNGKPLKLRGVNKHQDYLGLGNAVPDSLQVRDIEIIKEMGANFIRLAHYPHDPAVLDACDRYGLLVWSEIPLVNTVGGEKFIQNTKQMMREMVRQARNHPSVILWGITNESAMRFSNKEQLPKISKLLQELHEISQAEDPSRLTIQAHNHFKDIALAEITDVIGRNRYYGWYEGVIEDFGKVMDEEHKVHPDWKIIISEYGVGSKLGYHVDNPVAFDFSEEYQLNFHEHYWQVIQQRPWIAGSAVWNAFDFGSFVKVGNIPRINQKGLCDMARRPKDAYYFYQSQWSEKPMVYIVSHTRRHIEGTEGETNQFRVYSNCDQVELFLNGKSLGQKQKEYVFRWDVNLNAGENQLTAVARKGNKVVEDQIDVIYIIEGNK